MCAAVTGFEAQFTLSLLLAGGLRSGARDEPANHWRTGRVSRKPVMISILSLNSYAQNLMAALYWQSNPASLSLSLKTFALATDYNVFKKMCTNF